MVKKIKSCVLISGKGTNLSSLIKSSRDYNFPIKIALIISNNKNATGLLLAKKYLPKGSGSVFTFGLKGGYGAGVEFVEKCQLLCHLANIGDTRSLVLHPASTTHRQLTETQRISAGAGDDVIRLSIGLETVEDIIADLEQALR